MTTLDRRSLLWAMMLSFLAGYVDSLGFLELGGYFVSFMSGNTTRLGISIGDAEWRPAAVVAGFIALFVSGVVLGSLIASKAETHRRSIILFLIVVLLSLSAVLYEFQLLRFGTITMLLAMGAENTILRRDGVSIGLTYMTGNLVKLGHAVADRLRGIRHGNDILKYAGLWLALALGAAMGSILHRQVQMQALWLAVALALGLGGFALKQREAVGE